MSSRKSSLEAYFLIKARSETPTYRFNSVGHCSNSSLLTRTSLILVWLTLRNWAKPIEMS
jgi:hypothetical protein